MPSKNPETLERITMLISILRICSTEQISGLFSHRGSPDKRASEYLRILEDKKLIEGFRREMGLSKIWRLTKKGRTLRGVDYQPVSPKGHNRDHFIAIGDAYFQLDKIGKVRRFFLEPREEFKSGIKSYKYAPDAYVFLEIGGRIKPLILEVQSTPLTSKRWAEKWAIASQFFDSGSHKKAAFQIMKDREVRPQILAITSQQEETVRTGIGSLPLLIVRTAADLSFTS